MAKRSQAQPDRGEPAALVARRLAMLERLQTIGMNLAERIERVSAGAASEAEAMAFAGHDLALAFARVSRSVRQSIVLEQEMMGLRQAPGSRMPAASGLGTGARREAPGAARRGPMTASEYREFYDTDEFREHLKRDEEIGRRIHEVLKDIRDGKLGADEPVDPDAEAELEAKIDWSVYGIKNIGKPPPSGCGP